MGISSSQRLNIVQPFFSFFLSSPVLHLLAWTYLIFSSTDFSEKDKKKTPKKTWDYI